MLGGEVSGVLYPTTGTTDRRRWILNILSMKTLACSLYRLRDGGADARVVIRIRNHALQ